MGEKSRAELSRVSLALEPQLVRALFMKAKEFDDVIDLTLGDPDLPTPARVIDAAHSAMSSGKTHYTANAGLPGFRKAISDDIYRRLGVRYNPASEIIVTPGAMGALQLSAQSLLNPDDEVLILAPHWPNYTNIVKMCLAKPIDIPSYGESELATLIPRLRQALTPRTRMLIINSPCNPSGQALSWETLNELAAFAVNHNLLVISDEVYHTITYGAQKHESILGFEGMAARGVLVDSMSKRFSMTGWRVGFAAAPAHVIGKMTELQEHVSSCVAPFSQLAAMEALIAGEEDARAMTAIFKRRCTYLAARLNGIPGISCRMPVATFYLFADIRATGLDSMAFAYQLLEQERVALVPGNAFGACGEGYVRIACTVPEEKLEQAAARIRRFTGNLKIADNQAAIG